MCRVCTLMVLVLLGLSVLWGQSTSSSQSTVSPSQAPTTQSGGSATNPQSPSTPGGSASGETSQDTGSQTTAVPAQSAPAQAQSPASMESPATIPSQPASTGTASSEGNSAPGASSGYPQQVAPAPMGAAEVPVNTEMHATLDTPLSTKTSKPGDRFTATVQNPVRGSNGEVIIPPGSRVEGEISDADEGNAAALKGKVTLSLRFRNVALANGQSFPLSATLVSVNSTNGRDTKKADSESQIQSGKQGKDEARDVGIGAGSIPGLIFGSPLKGLAIGSLEGGGYVLATKGKEVDLPAQTGMVIRLEQPISINGQSTQAPGER